MYLCLLRKSFLVLLLLFPLSIVSETKVDSEHTWESVVDGFIWRKIIRHENVEIIVALEKVVVKRNGNVKKTFRFHQMVACQGTETFDTTVWLIGSDIGTRTSCNGSTYPFSIPQFFEEDLKPFPKEVEETPPLKKRDKPGLQI